MADVSLVAGCRVRRSGGPFPWKHGPRRDAALSHFRGWRGYWRGSLLGFLTRVRGREPARSQRHSPELRVGATGLREEHAGRAVERVRFLSVPVDDRTGPKSLRRCSGEWE